VIGTRKAGMAQLLRYWIPSTAPAGITFYTGDNFSRWQSNLLVGALKDQMLVRLDLNGEKVVSEERLLKNLLGPHPIREPSTKRVHLSAH
jgi:glucose/arabinose dehydrogenase